MSEMRFEAAELAKGAASGGGGTEGKWREKKRRSHTDKNESRTACLCGSSEPHRTPAGD